MNDINPDDTPMFLSEAAVQLKCSEKTLDNWTRKGFRQMGTGTLVYLETTKWLGKRYVTMAAIARFRAAIQAPVESEPVETPAERKRTLAVVKKALKERHGVGA